MEEPREAPSPGYRIVPYGPHRATTGGVHIRQDPPRRARKPAVPTRCIAPGCPRLPGVPRRSGGGRGRGSRVRASPCTPGYSAACGSKDGWGWRGWQSDTQALVQHSPLAQRAELTSATTHVRKVEKSTLAIMEHLQITSIRARRSCWRSARAPQNTKQSARARSAQTPFQAISSLCVTESQAN